MKDKAIEFLSKLQTDDLEFIHDRVIGIMLEFGHYVAEEQKKQCLKEIIIECDDLKLEHFDKKSYKNGFLDPIEKEGIYYQIVDCLKKPLKDGTIAFGYRIDEESFNLIENVCEQ
jgi:hypothetical protein